MSVRIGVTQEHDGRYVEQPGSSAGIKEGRGEDICLLIYERREGRKKVSEQSRNTNQSM
jgi:hypothetical protein